MKYKDKIIRYFDELPEGTVVVANVLYESGFTTMKQEAFFRAMERLSDEGSIIRIARGLYIGVQDASKDRDELLLNYYFGDNNAEGMFTGYKLYNKYSLTEYDDGQINLYSNVSKTSISRIGNITVKRPGIELGFDNTRIIEALEILQNYEDIIGLDKNKFAVYIRQFSRGYSDEAAVEVIHSMKYKKKTIAFMKKVLDTCKVSNSLQQFLSHASDYRVPAVAGLIKRT